MQCPSCADQALEPHVRLGIEIDVCPVCKGVWLDRGELDRLAAEPPARVPDLARYAPTPAAPTGPVTTAGLDDRDQDRDRDRDDDRDDDRDRDDRPRDRDDDRHRERSKKKKPKKRKPKSKRLSDAIEDLFDDILDF